MEEGNRASLIYSNLLGGMVSSKNPCKCWAWLMLMRFRQQALVLAKKPIAPTYVLLLDKKRKRQDSKQVNKQKGRQSKAYLKRK